MFAEKKELFFVVAPLLTRRYPRASLHVIDDLSFRVVSHGSAEFRKLRAAVDELYHQTGAPPRSNTLFFRPLSARYQQFESFERCNARINFEKIANKSQEERCYRAGIIPVTRDPHSGAMWLCMARDSKHRELTDFGGGLRQTDRCVLQGVMRELAEESLGVFGITEETVLWNTATIHHHGWLVSFVGVDYGVITTSVARFANAPRENIHAEETSDIVWIPETLWASLFFSINNEMRVFSRLLSLVRLIGRGDAASFTDAVRRRACETLPPSHRQKENGSDAATTPLDARAAAVPQILVQSAVAQA